MNQSWLIIRIHEVTRVSNEFSLSGLPQRTGGSGEDESVRITIDLRRGDGGCLNNDMLINRWNLRDDFPQRI